MNLPAFADSENDISIQLPLARLQLPFFTLLRGALVGHRDLCMSFPSALMTDNVALSLQTFTVLYCMNYLEQDINKM